MTDVVAQTTDCGSVKKLSISLEMLITKKRKYFWFLNRFFRESIEFTQIV